MLKTSKTENWNGESIIDDKTVALFYASINSQGQIETITMNPMDFDLYMAHIMDVTKDFSEFQNKVIQSTNNWEV